MLTRLSSFLSLLNLKIYIFIDEYDNFTNTILAQEGVQAYNELCHGDGVFKEFFKILKATTAATASAVKRIFITGISPVTMDDVASGFNIGMNISDSPQFAEMLGLTHQDVRDMLDYYSEQGILQYQKELAFQLIQKWLDGYRFTRYSNVPLCNTTSTLKFIHEIISKKLPPVPVYDSNIRMDYVKLQHLITVDNHLNGNFNLLQRLAVDRKVHATLTQSFQIREITVPDNFATLLVHYGLAAIGNDNGDMTELVVPNNTVDKFVNDLVTDGYARAGQVNTRLQDIADGMRKMAMFGDWKSCMDIVANVAKNCISIRDLQECEKTVQSTLNALLHASSVLLSKTEVEAAGGFADLTLAPNLAQFPDVSYAVIIELKYLKACEKPTDSEIANLRDEASTQLNKYIEEHRIRTLWQLAPTGHVRLIRLIMIFHGADCILCDECI